ncbi:U7 snRNA-associated Sm-like protein LSm10 [Liolophura sinensis]|uniref:U7 snRNA-associated Sm-like protein LSm10 n=1 Tax=Liolophura sinensis TaxID=3198878 RepID=UPI0031582565
MSQSDTVYRPIIAPREKALSKQSLICLLQGLHDTVTTVELRNENAVTGRVEHVDAFMCVTMRNVTLKMPDGRCMRFSDFFVHGSNVRYIHIPDHINIRRTIEYNCNREKRAMEQLKKEHDLRVAAAQKKIERRQKQLAQKEAKQSTSKT